MWDNSNTIIKETNCIAYHPYYGKAQVLLTDDNKPLFYFVDIGGSSTQVILDSVPPYEITAKVGESTSVKLTQFGANEFANVKQGYYYVDNRLRIDGVFAKPYNYNYDDVWIGPKYWSGSGVIDWWLTDGGTQTFKLKEQGDGDTEATIQVINSAFGFWEKKKGSESGYLGIYIGKGAYEGEYRYIGTPTWQTESEKITITTHWDEYENEQIPNELTLNEEEDVYIIGTYGSDKGWREIPKGAFVFGDDITAIGRCNEINEDGSVPIIPADIILKWKGFTDNRTDLARVWVADTPSWR